MSTTPSDDLPDVEEGFDYPDSLDALAWAEAFSRADDDTMDTMATWFAAALMQGQKDPTGEVEMNF